MQSWAEVLQKSELFVYLHSRCAWKLVPNAPRAGEGPCLGLRSGCGEGGGAGEEGGGGGHGGGGGCRSSAAAENAYFLTKYGCESVGNIPTFSSGISCKKIFTTFCHQKAAPKVSAGHLRRDRTAVLTERAQNDVQQASAEAVRGLFRAVAVEAAQSFAPQRRSLS